jgi:serine/threonine protein phosphatase PrpC
MEDSIKKEWRCFEMNGILNKESVMVLEACGKSDVGFVRENNEDAFFVDKVRGIFIVADGVGGEQAGEVASNLAIEETVHYLEERWGYLEECRQGKYKDDAIFKFFADAVRHACKMVHQKGCENPQYSKMASTFTMALNMGTRILVCHVGDSRAYLISNAGVHQISEDHTLAKDFIKKGLIRKEDESSSPLSNVLTRAIGTYSSVEVDCVLISVFGGDKIILCTDGVSNYLKDEEDLVELVNSQKVSVDVGNLIHFSLMNKGEDNATAIVIKVLEKNEVSDFEFLQEGLITEILLSCQIYEGLTFSQLARMRSHMEVVFLKKNEVLIQPCEKYNGFYIVMDGGILSGDELLVRGESIGLKSLIKEHCSHDSKVAVRDTRLILFTRKKFDSFSKRYPRIVNQILRNIIHIF